MRTLLPAALLSLLSFQLHGAGPAVSATVFSQPTCGTGNASCVTIDASTTMPATLRSFMFNAPRSGRVEAFFQGSMTCTNTASTAKTVELTAQITTGAAITPSINGPGGLRHSTRLRPSATGSFDSFSLAARRVIDIPAAEAVNLHFRVNGPRLDPLVSCALYNLTFTVVFTP